MPSVNHTHMYVRYKTRPGYYRCDLPDCTHVLDKEAVQGKQSLCTVCHEKMILTREDVRRARPRCINCSDTKKGRTFRRAQELTRYLGTDQFNTLGGVFKKPPVTTSVDPTVTDTDNFATDLYDDLKEEEEEDYHRTHDKWRLG